MSTLVRRDPRRRATRVSIRLVSCTYNYGVVRTNGLAHRLDLGIQIDLRSLRPTFGLEGTRVYSGCRGAHTSWASASSEARGGRRNI